MIYINFQKKKKKRLPETSNCYDILIYANKYNVSTCTYIHVSYQFVQTFGNEFVSDRFNISTIDILLYRSMGKAYACC